MEYSKYQELIFDAVTNGTGNIVVNALAGSGKTSTLLECANRIDPEKKVLLAAFNKRIKEELERHVFSGNVQCKTLHSLGFAAVRKVHPFVQLDANKNDDIINSLKFNIPNESYAKIMQGLKQTVSLAKALLQDTPTKMKSIVEEYDIDYTPYNIDEFVKMAFDVLEKSKKMVKIIDYDDQIYHPVIFQYPVEKFDYIFIDEAQDMNLSQMKLALMTKRDSSRIFVFCDFLQAIYGFRGADSKQIRSVIAELEAKHYDLPICYRCPNKVIELAKEFAPLMESPPGNKDGEVNTIFPPQVYKTAKPGDFILSRKNAPLIVYCLNFLKLGIPANIAGRDIAIQLVNLVKKARVKTMAGFLEKIEDMRAKEVARAYKEHKSPDAINDKYECLTVLADSCKTVKELTDKINSIFVDVPDSKRVILSSVHQSKGLQRENVFLIRNTFSFADDEEKNIYYVAITRTQNRLYFIEKEDKKDKDKKKQK